MFQDQRMFEAFTNRSFSLIGLPNTKKPKYRQLLGYIYELYPQEVKEILERINEINKEKILDVLNQIPDEAMCIVQKEWVLKLLQYRKEWLIQWYMEVR
ncbi:hypothetical protein [Parageobacillus sp. G301]|uniref:hypothetical protein n=1 Tax=Parageobacillus sp. G301 TaxID=2998290 RepID=UPI0025538139|nr:hypothetical protein [Parageobacillus sp. G301]